MRIRFPILRLFRAICSVAVVCAALAAADVAPKTTQDWFAEGNAKFGAGEYAAAIEAYNRLLELQPKADNALLLRARAKWALQDRSGARADVAAALNLNARNPGALATRALFRFEQEEYAGALADLDDAIAGQPKDAELHFLRAEVLAKFERSDDALAALDQALRLDEGLTAARFLRARLRVDQDQGEDALADLDRVVREAPRAADAWSQRSWVHFHRLDWAAAIRDGQQTTELAPKASDGPRVTGYAQFGAGEFSAAAATLEVAATLDSGAAAAFPWFVRHFALLRAGAGADGRLAQAAAKWKDDEWCTALARFLLGTIGEEELEALAAAPTDDADRKGRECEANFYIGLARLHAGDRSTARLRFRTAVATERRTFIEHALAQAELHRLERK